MTDEGTTTTSDTGSSATSDSSTTSLTDADTDSESTTDQGDILKEWREDPTGDPLIEALCDWAAQCCHAGEFDFLLGPFTGDRAEACKTRMLEAYHHNDFNSELLARDRLNKLSSPEARLLGALAFEVNLERTKADESAINACVAKIRANENCNERQDQDHCSAPFATPEDPCLLHNMFEPRLSPGSVNECNATLRAFYTNNYDIECGYGSNCEIITPGSHGIARCAAKGREGEFCQPTSGNHRNECEDDLYCSDLGLCQPRPVLGETCRYAQPSRPLSQGEGRLDVPCLWPYVCDPVDSVCVEDCGPGDVCGGFNNHVGVEAFGRGVVESSSANEQQLANETAAKLQHAELYGGALDLLSRPDGGGLAWNASKLVQGEHSCPRGMACRPFQHIGGHLVYSCEDPQGARLGSICDNDADCPDRTHCSDRVPDGAPRLRDECRRDYPFPRAFYFDEHGKIIRGSTMGSRSGATLAHYVVLQNVNELTASGPTAASYVNGDSSDGLFRAHFPVHYDANDAQTAGFVSFARTYQDRGDGRFEFLPTTCESGQTANAHPEIYTSRTFAYKVDHTVLSNPAAGATDYRKQLHDARHLLELTAADSSAADNEVRGWLAERVKARNHQLMDRVWDDALASDEGASCFPDLRQGRGCSRDGECEANLYCDPLEPSLIEGKPGTCKARIRQATRFDVEVDPNSGRHRWPNESERADWICSKNSACESESLVCAYTDTLSDGTRLNRDQTDWYCVSNSEELGHDSACLPAQYRVEAYSSVQTRASAYPPALQFPGDGAELFDGRGASEHERLRYLVDRQDDEPEGTPYSDVQTSQYPWATLCGAGVCESSREQAPGESEAPACFSGAPLATPCDHDPNTALRPSCGPDSHCVMGRCLAFLAPGEQCDVDSDGWQANEARFVQGFPAAKCAPDTEPSLDGKQLRCRNVHGGWYCAQTRGDVSRTSWCVDRGTP